MGARGSSGTAGGAEAAGRLVDALAPMGEVTSRKMFGGVGVFHEGVMFALVDPAGECYLRADDGSAAAFEAEGSARHGKMPYWRVPDPVMADDGELLAWSRRAADVAHAAKR